ncbi:uncharacterized protein LOC144110967 [Amblyomma americanum]
MAPTAAKSPMKRSFQQPAGWLQREMGDAPYVAAPVQESPDGNESTAALLVSDVSRGDPGFSAPRDAPQGRKARGTANPPGMLATTSAGRPEVAQRSGKLVTHKREMNVYVEFRKPGATSGGGALVASEQATRTCNLPSTTGDPGPAKDGSVVGSEASLTVDTSIQHRKASLLETISTSVSAALGKFFRRGSEQPAPAPRSSNATQKGADRHTNMLPAELSEEIEMNATDVSGDAHTRHAQQPGGLSTSHISIEVVSVRKPAEAGMPQGRYSLKHKLEDKQRRRSPQSTKDSTSEEMVDKVPPLRKEATGKTPLPKQRKKGRKAPERPSRDQEQLVQPLPQEVETSPLADNSSGKKMLSEERASAEEHTDHSAASSPTDRRSASKGGAKKTSRARLGKRGSDVTEKTIAEGSEEELYKKRTPEKEGRDDRGKDAQTVGAFEPHTQSRRGSAGDKKRTRRDSDLKDAAQENAEMAVAQPGKESSRQWQHGKYEEGLRSPDEAGKSILRTDAKSKSHAIPFQRRLSTKTADERFAAALQRDEGAVSPKAPKKEGKDGHLGDTYDADVKAEASPGSPASKRQSLDEGRRSSKPGDREARKKKNKDRTSRRVSESTRSKRKRSTESKSEKSHEDHREAPDVKKEGEDAAMVPDGGLTKEDDAVAKKPPRVAEENTAAEVDKGKHGVSDGKGTSKKKGSRKSKTRPGSIKGGAEGLEPERVKDRKAHEEQDVEDANEKLRTVGQEIKHPVTSGEVEAQAGDSKMGSPVPVKGAGVSTLIAGEIPPEAGPTDTAEKHRQKVRGDEGGDRGSRRPSVKKRGDSRKSSVRGREKRKKKSKPDYIESVEVSMRCAETQTCLAAPVVDAGGASCRDFNFGMTLSPYTTGTLARKELKTAGAPLLHPSQLAVTSGEQSWTKPKEDLKEEVTPPPAPKESKSSPKKIGEDGPSPQTKRGKRKKGSKRGTSGAADKKADRSKAKSGRQSKSKKGKKRKRPSEKQDEESKAAKPEDDKDKELPEELGGGEDEKDIHEKKDKEPSPRDQEREGESAPKKQKRKKKSAKGKKEKRKQKLKEDKKKEADRGTTGELMPFLFRWGPATIPIFPEYIRRPLSSNTMQLGLDEGERPSPREDAWSIKATVSTKDGTHGLPLSSSEFPPPDGEDKLPVPAVDGLENEPAADADGVPKKDVSEGSPKEPKRKKKSRSKDSKKKRGRSKGSKKKRSRPKSSSDRPEGDRASKKGKRGGRSEGSLKHPKRTSKTEELGPSNVPTSAGELHRPLNWSTMQIGSEGTHALPRSSAELPSPEEADGAQAGAADVAEGPAKEHVADVDGGPKSGVTSESPEKPKRKKKKSRLKDSKKKLGRSKDSKKKRSRSKRSSEAPEGDDGSKKDGRERGSKSSLKLPKSTSNAEEERPFSFQYSTPLRPLCWSTMQTGPHSVEPQSPRGDVSPTKAKVSRKHRTRALPSRSSDMHAANEAHEQDVSKGPEERLGTHVVDGAADDEAKKLTGKGKKKGARFRSEENSEDLLKPSKKKRSKSKGSKKKQRRSKGSKKKRTRSKGSKKKRTQSKGSKKKRSRSKASSRRRKGGRGSRKGKRKPLKHKRTADGGAQSPERKDRKLESSGKSGSSKRSATKRKHDKKSRSTGDSLKGVSSPKSPSSAEEQLTRKKKSEEKASAKDVGGEEHRDFDFDISRRPVITGSLTRQEPKQARESGLITASAPGAESPQDEKRERRKRHARRKKTSKRKLDRERPSKTASPSSSASRRTAPPGPIDQADLDSRQERVPREEMVERKLSSDTRVPGRREFDFAIRQRPVTRGTLPRPELTQASEPEIVAAFERVQGAFVSPGTTGEEAARYASKSSSSERSKKKLPGKKHRERKSRKGHSRSTRSKSRHSRSKSGSRRSKSRRSRRSGKSPRSSSPSRRRKGRRSKSKRRGRKSHSRSKKSKSRESSRSKKHKKRRRHRRESGRRRKHGRRGGRRSKSPRKRSRSPKRRHRRKEKSDVYIAEAYSSARKRRGYWYLALTCLVIILMIVLCVFLLYYTLLLRSPPTGPVPPEPSTTAYTTGTGTSSERPPRTPWTSMTHPGTIGSTPATVSTPVPTPPPDTQVYHCSSDHCQREGRYISSLLKREKDPCDNFYQHVCSRWVERHVPDVPLHASLVSENTLVQDALLNKLVDIVLSAKHGDVQVAAKLYNACYDWSRSNDPSNKNLKTVFSQWTIGDWPRTAAVPEGAAAVWRFAAELVRDIGLTTIVTASVGVNPDSLDATLVELGQPVPLLRDAGSDNRDIRELFAGAVQEAMDFLGGTSTAFFVDKLFEARASLASLGRPSYSYSDDDHVNFVVRQFGQLGPGLREFLRVLLTNVRSRVNLYEKVVLRSAPYLLEELDGKLNQMAPLDVLNYMGFLVFVHVSPFLPINKVTRARLLFAETRMGYTAGANERNSLCSRLAEWVLPECFVKASQTLRQSTNQDVPAREWLSQLESVFLRHVADFIWMNDLNSLLVRYLLKRRATTQFGQLSGEQRQCAPRQRMNTEDPVLFFVNVSQHQQQRMLEGLVANSSVLRKRTAVSDLSGVATFLPGLQMIHVPAALFNVSVPTNSSVFVFHLARVAVRFYRALVQLLYENPYEREVPLGFTDESRWRQAALVECFGKDSRRVLPRLQGSYEAHLGRTFLDRTSALQLSLKAFDELYNVRRIWKLDLRLPDLPGTSAEQLFFTYFALDNCEYAHPDIHRELLPAEQRVNLPLRHTRRFAEAFHCRGQSPMTARDGDFCQVLRSDRRTRHAFKAIRSRSSDAVPAA